MSKRIDELKAKLMALSTLLDDNNKQKRDNTCLLSDSHNIKRDRGKKKPSQIQNKKLIERRKNYRIDRLHSQTEPKKKHKKPLKQDGSMWRSTGKSP